MNPVRGAFRPGVAALLVFVHLGALYGLWWCMTWGVTLIAVEWAVALYVVGLLGITVGYHRYATHGSFHCASWVKYLFVVFGGGLAGQGTIEEWRRNHLQHHKHVDGDFDPHSPWQYQHLPYPFDRIAGFCWAHFIWLLFETKRPDGYNPGLPAHDASAIAWQKKYYPHIVVAGFVLPFFFAGLPGLFLAGFVRLTAQYHVTWMVNSVCHLWGTRPVDAQGVVWQKDQSRNNLLVAIIGMGEGYHGNHHTQQGAANLGYRWYHWDPGKWVINILALLRQVRHVRRYRVA